MKKVLLAGAAITLATGGFLATQAKADTFYGVLVPMTTPVTLTSTEVSLTIGTTTTLTYSGGDGTGGYRFNNNSNGFCSINSAGVVTANFPGNCSFTVTRLASGKYLDTTSSALSLTALPEPDKSVISTPSPDPTPTVAPRVTPTPTTSPTPQASPAAVVRDRTGNSDTTIKAPVVIPLKKVSGVKAVLTPSRSGSTYKFTWAVNPAAVSYSINILTPEGKKTFTSQSPTINLENLIPGSYSIEIQAIDSKGKLSTPALSKFAVPAPKVVKLTAATSLTRPAISSSLAASLDRFSLQTTPGRTIKLEIEYTKSKSNDLNVKKLAELVKKYLAVKREASPVTIAFTAVQESGSIAVVNGVGEKESPTLLLRR